MFQRDTEEAHCGAQSEVVGEYETCRYTSYPPGTRLPGRCQKAHTRRLLHWKGVEATVTEEKHLRQRFQSLGVWSRDCDLEVRGEVKIMEVMPMSSLRPTAVVSQILSIEHQTIVKLPLRLFSIIWRCCGKSLRANQAHRQMRELQDRALDGSEVAIR